VIRGAVGRRVPSVAVLDTLARAPKNLASVTEPENRDVPARVLIANDGEVLSRLRLSAAEAARVCNVTPRQLIYWTKKGLVKPSADGEHDYDVYAMEKVIRIRQALAKGYSLEKAAQLVQRDLNSLQSDANRLDDLPPEDLEGELRRRLERLEERVVLLRRNLPTSLSVARLRRAVTELARLETMGELREGANGEGAKSLVMRLGRAVDELEILLREVQAPA
jgi:DNA-binding transcriptional MerR regulator